MKIFCSEILWKFKTSAGLNVIITKLPLGFLIFYFLRLIEIGYQGISHKRCKKGVYVQLSSTQLRFFFECLSHSAFMPFMDM